MKLKTIASSLAALTLVAAPVAAQAAPAARTSAPAAEESEMGGSWLWIAIAIAVVVGAILLLDDNDDAVSP
ncbi:hypothetical protein ACWPMX_01270 [Tsuneonella sp. HG094]|jgi:hypothetical protein